MVEALFAIQNLSEEDYGKMSRASLDIIKDWGLERFVDGAISACKHALQNKKRIRNPLDNILVHLWKGRFNISEATK